MRAIFTKYLPPTNRSGARVSVTDPGYAHDGHPPRRVIVSWDDALGADENHAAAARIALQRWEWDGVWVGGGFPTGDCFVHVMPADGLLVFNGGLPAGAKLRLP
jgi:hypothetical protein